MTGLFSVSVLPVWLGGGGCQKVLKETFFRKIPQSDKNWRCGRLNRLFSREVIDLLSFFPLFLLLLRLPVYPKFPFSISFGDDKSRTIFFTDSAEPTERKCGLQLQSTFIRKRSYSIFLSVSVCVCVRLLLHFLPIYFYDSNDKNNNFQWWNYSVSFSIFASCPSSQMNWNSSFFDIYCDWYWPTHWSVFNLSRIVLLQYTRQYNW